MAFRSLGRALCPHLLRQSTLTPLAGSQAASISTQSPQQMSYEDNGQGYSGRVLETITGRDFGERNELKFMVSAPTRSTQTRGPAQGISRARGCKAAHDELWWQATLVAGFGSEATPVALFSALDLFLTCLTRVLLCFALPLSTGPRHQHPDAPQRQEQPVISLLGAREQAKGRTTQLQPYNNYGENFWAPHFATKCTSD